MIPRETTWIVRILHGSWRSKRTLQRAVWFEGGLDSTLSVFTHRLACKISKVGATFTCLIELNGGMILVSEREAREHARSRQLTRSPKSRRKMHSWRSISLAIQGTVAVQAESGMPWRQPSGEETFVLSLALSDRLCLQSPTGMYCCYPTCYW